ncbi:AAA family ATPase [Cupriavidus necator]
MRIDKVSIENYCGARAVFAPTDEPVTLFCGLNGAGKTSIAEGVRFALTGMPSRVQLKGDHPSLVSTGAKVAACAVEYTAEDNAGFAASALPPLSHEQVGPALPADGVLRCLTNPRAFAQMEPNDRRTFLFDLMRVSLAPKEIAERLHRRGCDKMLAELAVTVLHAGFPAACKFAKERATEARGVWRSITGEVYGNKKGGDWTAAPAESYELDAHNAALERITRVQAAHEQALKELGALEEQARREGLSLACPHCGGAVILQGDALVPVEGAAGDAAEHLPMARSIVGQYADDLTALNLELAAHEDRKHSEAVAKKATEEAAAAHDEIIDWTEIAKHLAPDGLPAELLATAIRPFNRLLIDYAQLADWPRVQLNDDMAIEAEGLPYALLSESEQWRCDAVLTLAVAHFSGARFALFDRFDVLDIEGRAQLFNWLSLLANERIFDSVLVFGTLKAKPQDEPGFLRAYWVEAGQVGQQAKEAG